MAAYYRNGWVLKFCSIWQLQKFPLYGGVGIFSTIIAGNLYPFSPNLGESTSSLHVNSIDSQW